MLRRVAQIVVGVVLLWVLALAIGSFALGERTGARISERVGGSLQGSASLGGVDLALVRGRVELERLAVRRDDALGKLSLEVGEVRCALPPLGLALLDRECRELDVSGVRLEVSTLALLRLARPKHPPIGADRVVIRDAVLAFAPSAFLPSLGRVRVQIERAEAGRTRFRTPLSWVFALRELRARLELPAGLALNIAYRGGVLSASGSLFGSKPVEIPVKLPVRDATDDAQAELRKLVDFGKDVAERLVARRARDLVKSLR